MIVPISGNVTYAITLDPTVWIFDDRKIEFESAFDHITEHQDEEDEIEKASKRWDREVYQQEINPPINKSISKFEREKILKGSYVMPIEEFIRHAEAKSDAETATLIVEDGEDVTVSLEELKNSYLLFAIDGKPLKEAGPVHFYHKDGSNRDNPVKSLKKIVIN